MLSRFTQCSSSTSSIGLLSGCAAKGRLDHAQDEARRKLDRALSRHPLVPAVLQVAHQGAARGGARAQRTKGAP